MNWSRDFLTTHKSLGFYLREHGRISNEELALFFENPEEAKKLGKSYKQVHKELYGVIIKVLNDLYSLLKLVDYVDLYKEEFKTIRKNKKYFGEDFPEFEKSFQDKLRKYFVIHFLSYYQDRYNFLFSKRFGKNKKEIDLDKLLL